MARVSGFICQVLALAALVANGAAAVEEGIVRGEAFGGPHGTKYSDIDLVYPGQVAKSITIRSGRRVNAVCLAIKDPAGIETEMCHGGDKGDKVTINLSEGEYITGVEAHWGEYGSHTRVKYIRFTTNFNHTAEGGRPTENVGTDAAPKGYQLGGFYGTASRELDSVGMLWTSLLPV